MIARWWLVLLLCLGSASAMANWSSTSYGMPACPAGVGVSGGALLSCLKSHLDSSHGSSCVWNNTVDYGSQVGTTATIVYHVAAGSWWCNWVDALEYSCNSGYVQMGTSCQALAICTLPQVLNAATNTCYTPVTCEYPLIPHDPATSCDTCPVGQVGLRLSPTSIVCGAPVVCPAGEVTHDGLTCEIPVCTITQQYVPGVGCQEKTCPVGQLLNQLTGLCVEIQCPPNNILVGNVCQERTCPAGYVMSGNLCLPKVCPVTQVLIGDDCVAKLCPAGQVLNGVTGECVDPHACVNPAIYVWDDAKQSCVMKDTPITCAYGTVPSTLR